ncbi:hypothetical protein [Streptomyces sp. HGB0020]|uniref:hypothetical protein n=1 Tax=Streptomyces sp. HGB0020 TaxID=1078086 RepID=UPI00034EB3E9|nr:hypothetical protein [Streptomyces sp. HGB0020]EPD60537.1 hypothetical protein HMPREF1211_05289 [Streptomyces sp. HGB0020]
MTQHDTYGTCAHSANELVRLVTDLLEVTFTERESDYRGIYHVADGDFGRMEIQPNPIPGDDDEADLYAPEHPTIQALLLITTPTPDPALQRTLSSINGLAHLNQEAP